MTGESDPAPHRIGSRDAARRPLKLMVQARDGHVRLLAEALDLSVTGIRLRTLSPLRLGSRYWLKIAHLEGLEMSVVWIDGLICGCRFVQPLHPAVYDALMGSLDSE